MDKNLSNLLKDAYIYPETSLSKDIWQAILVKQERVLKIKSNFYALLGILSFGFFVVVVNTARVQFVSSGFFSYLSLLFSDGGLIALYWKEYLLSLSDSIPYASLGSSVFLLFSTLISAKKFINQHNYKLSIIK